MSNPVNNAPQQTFKDSPVLSYLLHLERKGMKHPQLRNCKWILETIAKNADLNNPDTVDEYIARRNGAETYKHRLTGCYASYCYFMQIPYKPPHYPRQNKPIKIPTLEKVKMIIAESGKTMATKLTLSLETGLRPIELHNLKVKDVDLEQRLIYPKTAKNGEPRTLKISANLAMMIQDHIIRGKMNPEDQLFKGTPVSYGKEYREVRIRLARKLNDPTLRTVRLYDLRHYFATNLYHQTKDILYVKQQMGHKRIDTTLIYTQLLNLNEPDNYTAKIAKTIEEATNLIENGFEYVTEMDGMKLFRKRK